jgi:hypothetical protein
MRALYIAVVASSLFLFCLSLAAQEPGTEVMVKIPSAPSSSFTEARVTVNGKTQTASPGASAVFNVPAKAGDNVSVEITLVRKREFGSTDIKRWRQNTRLNGSGHLDYYADIQGTGFFGQWPLVDFQGSVPLDVLIDGSIEGTTEMSKGVHPDEAHTFKWRNGTSDVCSKEVALPVNVTRTYLCDAATKKVTER